jgi:predicted extracellular nuclease
VLAVPVAAFAPPTATVFISEIHYDNAGTDTGEAVEVFGPAGTVLTGWTIVEYNGSNGQSYATVNLPSPIPDLGGGYGVVSVAAPGLQNGAPDAIALVDATSTVRQFLSYEGVFTATNGPANGLTSTDIGVSQNGSEAIGLSLQLTGAGTTYGALSWQPPAASSFGAINAGTTQPVDNCPDVPAVTLVHQVQGSTDTSPCAGETVRVEGVVVGDYEGASPNLRGFYVQEDDADVDADPATSEGVFVFNGADTDLVALGDRVRVEGAVSEFQGQTQITLGTVSVLSTGASITSATPTLPVPTATHLERFEGMQVVFGQVLYVTEFFQLGRFGQVVVSANDRLDQPTQVAAPGAPAAALQAANDLNRLIIDDALQTQNPDPIVFGRGGNPLSASNTLRGGDTVTGAAGVLTYTWSGNSASGNAYRLRPASPTSPVPTFTPANPRPLTAPAVGGSLKVAGLNVLNYFLTLDVGTTPACGPVGNQQECRGAETSQELQRQRDKLLAALLKIDGDIVGLVELENTPNVDPLSDIVAGLNTLTAPGTYAAIDTGVIGTDAIRVGLIYRPAAVTPLGSHAVLDSSVDPQFDTTKNRPALAQSFQTTGGEVLTVVVNHFKSKGSCPAAADPDADQGDGQSCWNPTRTAAAGALVDWLATHPTGALDDDFLLLGDYNSYAEEDPITELTAAGYVDLAELFGEPYSYVFDGQWGTLDYAFASPSLVAQVVGTADYHINSDEPSVLDYNTNFKSAGQVASLYTADEFRMSDHDPVLVGLSLGTTPPAEIPEAPLALLLPISAVGALGIVGMLRRRRAI